MGGSHKYVDSQPFVISALPISLPPFENQLAVDSYYFSIWTVAQFVVNKQGVFRWVAVALLALCACFTFPENYYSIDKTFVKAPSPQTEVSSLLCDDVEDSNDLSTEIHFFQNPAPAWVGFSLKKVSSAFTASATPRNSYEQIFLRHRQLLIWKLAEDLRSFFSI